MATRIEIEKLALTLPEKQRATLAAKLLESLPACYPTRMMEWPKLCAVMKISM